MMGKMCFLLIIMRRCYRLNRDLKGTVAKKSLFNSKGQKEISFT